MGRGGDARRRPQGPQPPQLSAEEIEIAENIDQIISEEIDFINDWVRRIDIEGEAMEQEALLEINQQQGVMEQDATMEMNQHAPQMLEVGGSSEASTSLEASQTVEPGGSNDASATLEAGRRGETEDTPGYPPKHNAETSGTNSFISRHSQTTSTSTPFSSYRNPLITTSFGQTFSPLSSTPDTSISTSSFGQTSSSPNPFSPAPSFGQANMFDTSAGLGSTSSGITTNQIGFTQSAPSVFSCPMSMTCTFGFHDTFHQTQPGIASGVDGSSGIIGQNTSAELVEDELLRAAHQPLGDDLF